MIGSLSSISLTLTVSVVVTKLFALSRTLSVSVKTGLASLSILEPSVVILLPSEVISNGLNGSLAMISTVTVSKPVPSSSASVTLIVGTYIYMQ